MVEGHPLPPPGRRKRPPNRRQHRLLHSLPPEDVERNTTDGKTTWSSRARNEVIPGFSSLPGRVGQYNEIGVEFLEKGNTDMARLFLLKAEVLTRTPASGPISRNRRSSKRNGRLHARALTYQNMSALYLRQGQDGTAGDYERNAIRMEIASNTSSNPAKLHLELSDKLALTEQYGEAAQHAEQAVAILVDSLKLGDEGEETWPGRNVKSPHRMSVARLNRSPEKGGDDTTIVPSAMLISAWQATADALRARKVLLMMTPVLGITVDEGPKYGVTVVAVREGSPADLAGIRAGDLLWQVGHVNVNDLEAMQHAIKTAAPGETKTLIIQRKGQRGFRSIPVTFGGSLEGNDSSIEDLRAAAGAEWCAQLDAKTMLMRAAQAESIREGPGDVVPAAIGASEPANDAETNRRTASPPLPILDEDPAAPTRHDLCSLLTDAEHKLALYREQIGDFDGAMRAHRAAYEHALRYLGPRHSKTAHVRTDAERCDARMKATQARSARQRQRAAARRPVTAPTSATRARARVPVPPVGLRSSSRPLRPHTSSGSARGPRNDNLESTRTRARAQHTTTLPYLDASRANGQAWGEHVHNGERRFHGPGAAEELKTLRPPSPRAIKRFPSRAVYYRRLCESGVIPADNLPSAPASESVTSDVGDSATDTPTREQLNAAARIKMAWRTHNAGTFDTDTVDAAVAAQRVWDSNRASMATYRETKQARMAVKIQARWRGASARARLERETNAAVAIQALYRGSSVRSKSQRKTGTWGPIAVAYAQSQDLALGRLRDRITAAAGALPPVPQAVQGAPSTTFVTHLASRAELRDNSAQAVYVPTSEERAASLICARVRGYHARSRPCAVPVDTADHDDERDNNPDSPRAATGEAELPESPGEFEEATKEDEVRDGNGHDSFGLVEAVSSESVDDSDAKENGGSSGEDDGGKEGSHDGKEGSGRSGEGDGMLGRGHQEVSGGAASAGVPPEELAIIKVYSATTFHPGHFMYLPTKSAVSIQSAFRGHRARKDFKRKVDAVVCLQARCRGVTSRRAAARGEARTRTVSSLEEPVAVTDGRVTERLCPVVVAEGGETERFYSTNSVVSHLIMESDSDDDEDDSARVLGKHVRGWLARRKLSPANTRGDEARYASTITARVRGYMARAAAVPSQQRDRVSRVDTSAQVTRGCTDDASSVVSARILARPGGVLPPENSESGLSDGAYYDAASVIAARAKAHVARAGPRAPARQRAALLIRSRLQGSMARTTAPRVSAARQVLHAHVRGFLARRREDDASASAAVRAPGCTSPGPATPAAAVVVVARLRGCVARRGATRGAAAALLGARARGQIDRAAHVRVGEGGAGWPARVSDGEEEEERVETDNAAAVEVRHF